VGIGAIAELLEIEYPVTIGIVGGVIAIVRV
jgi:hypothetical protein